MGARETLWCFSVSGWLLVSSVYADTPADQTGSQLSEVVVTAQRREQRLQDVPITVSALSADMLTQERITSVDSLNAKVPGLLIERELSSIVPFLRGVGQLTGQVGVEGSVSMYIDGVYIPSAAGALFDFNNVDRIEVLKGPQGTLFGRNATGGVIQVITRNPQQTPELDTSLTYANYNTIESDVYATTGVTDHLAVDFAAHQREQLDGWGRNLPNGTPSYADSTYGFRAKALYTPTDIVRVVLEGDYSRDNLDETTAIVPGATALAGYVHEGTFYDDTSGSRDYSHDRQYGFSAHVDVDLSIVKIVDITAYRDIDQPYKVDQDDTPLNIVTAAPLNAREKTFTQEIQLQSVNNRTVTWILGGYYMHDVGGYYPFDLQGAAVAPLDLLSINGQTTLNSISGFGQATVEVLPDTHITAGARYTHDARDVIGTTDGVLGGAEFNLVPTTRQDATYEKPSWRFTVDHKFAQDIMAYASYNRGFKSGFFNVITYTEPTVKPETIDAYETGLKTELFDHVLRVNTAAFLYKLKDMQLPETESGATVFLNAAAATIKGLETDVLAEPIKDFTVSTALAYTHGRYTSFPNAPLFTPDPTGGNFLTSFNASGEHTVHTPEVTANVNANYMIHTSRGTVEPDLDYTYTGAFCWYPDCRVPQRAYSLVDASLNWRSLSDRWGVQAWVKNLFDREYYRWAQEQTPDDQYMPAAPRTYGVTFSAKFR